MNTNLNNRLTSAKQKLNNNIKTAPQRNQTILGRLTGLTDTFKNIFTSANPDTKSNTTTSSSNNKKPAKTNNTNTQEPTSSSDNPFNNPILLFLLLAITLGFIGYGLYRYYSTETEIQNGKSFYGQDILTYQPIFKMTTDKLEKCIPRCEADPMCSGITYNADEQLCVGTKNGVLRDDAANISSWIKPADQVGDIKTDTLLGYVSSYKVITADKISFPSNPYEFSWSMFIYVNDFYANHGSWRHILHKGTEPDARQLETQNWEDILSEYPDQSIGLWMAPFNNNIRIAITTLTTNYADGSSRTSDYPHAMAQAYDGSGNVFLSDKPNNPLRDPTKTKNKRQVSSYNKNVEFIDIPHFPNKVLTHLTVNVINDVVEIYRNGLLTKSYTLAGRPEFNKGNLYIMKPKTLDGSLHNLTYTPGYLNLASIRDIMAVKDKIIIS